MKQIDSAFQEYGTNEWENQTLKYNLTKYNFPKVILNLINEILPKDTKYFFQLDQLHEVLPPFELQKLTEKVQSALSHQTFQKMFDDFAEEYIKPLIDNKRYLIKRYPTLNLVIPNQTIHARKLPFHQGIFYNNGRGMRTIWMPLTKCWSTNSMYIASLEDSRKLTKKVLAERINYKNFEEECLKISKPVELEPGQAHLFHQEHIHGNVNNETNKTRLAIDWHVLIEDEEYGGRFPGGFFRLPGDYDKGHIYDFAPDRQYITYVGNNTEFDKDIPLHMQRMVIDDYYSKINCKPDFVQFENEFMDWLPILENIIETKTHRLHSVVMLSIYSLPEDPEIRHKIYALADKHEVEMHFANEMLQLKNDKDFSIIEDYYTFGHKKKGKFYHE